MSVPEKRSDVSSGPATTGGGSKTVEAPVFPPAAWCVREAPLALDGRIHRAFEAQVERTPEAVAVIDGERRLTYRELNARGNRLARALRADGVVAGDCVALCVQRSLELIVGQLGVLKAGAAYVPIEASYPEARLRLMLEDTAARLVLARSDWRADLPPLGVTVRGLEEAWARDATLAGDNLVVEVAPDATAVVFYTSGSTGRPKGVEVRHESVVRLISRQEQWAMRPEDRMLMTASPLFDGISFEVWLPLLSGAACVVNADRWLDFERLESLVRTHGVTHTFLTTSLFNQLVDLRPRALATLRQIYIGGEALSAAHIRRALELLPGVGLNNAYGPTEGTTFAVSYRIPAPTEWGCESVPIGVPIQHTECQIVDEQLRRVPIGEVGELLLGGIGVARGYLNSPELTAERFVRPPWGEGGRVYYRTGDLCRWLPSGLIEYVGRADQQIKLRGFRIELGEIEAAARECAGVAEAAVIAHRLADGRTQLVLFLVPEKTSLSTAAVLQELRTRLPEQMVPARVEVADALPLTASGKTDRRALAARLTPAAAAAPAEAVEAAVASAGGFEARLVAIWRRLLGQPQLHGGSDFFQEGGDSLLAVQVALEVARECGWPVPVGVIFAYPTPARLAAQLEAMRSEPEKLTPPLQGAGEAALFVLVPGLGGVARVSPALAAGLQGKRRYFDGLQFAAPNPAGPFLERVEDIAATLIEQLRAAYPKGPMILYGFSLGGLVAFEMARQLRAAGRVVELVILGDSTLAAAHPYRPDWERRLMLVLDVFRRPWKEAPGKIAKLVRSTRSRPMVPALAGVDCAATPEVAAGVRAFEAYAPGQYAGRVALIRCKIVRFAPERRMTREHDYGWGRRITGELTVHGVKLHHDDLLGDAANAPILEVLATLGNAGARDEPGAGESRPQARG